MGAAKINIKRAYTFLGRTQLNWIFLWDAIELEDWCIAPVSLIVRRIHGERVLISLFCSMGFVVWVVTYLWLAQLGGDRKGVEKEQN